MSARVSGSHAARRAVQRYLFPQPPKARSFRVMPYHWPDIDGVASAVAAQELLRKMGYEAASAMIAQTPQKEAIWAMRELGFSPSKVEDWMQTPQVKTDEVVLVDVSDHQDLPPGFPTERVKVVIDHRAYPDLSRMKGAVTWIDRVGAAATLVGELYQGQGVKPDDRCAQILYAAIMSNTVGLSSRNTTDRDRAMADYLAHAGKFDSKFVEEMFRHKSEMDEPLYNRIDEDLSTKNQRMGEYICSIAQLEINDVEQVLVERRDELNDALEKLKEERGADQIFLIGIDLRSKKTFFHFLDPVMQVLIASKFPLRPRGRLSFLDHVVTRKDVIAAFNTTDEMSASVSQ